MTENEGRSPEKRRKTDSLEERRRDIMRTLEELNEECRTLRSHETESEMKARKLDLEAAKAGVEKLRKQLNDVSDPKLRYVYGEEGFFYESCKQQELISREFERELGFDYDLERACGFKFLTEPLLNLRSKDELCTSDGTVHKLAPSETTSSATTTKDKSTASGNESTNEMHDFVLDPIFFDPDQAFSKLFEQPGKRGFRYWYDHATPDALRNLSAHMRMSTQSAVDTDTPEDILEYSLRLSCLDRVAALGSMTGKNVGVIPHLTAGRMSGIQRGEHIGGGISADLVICQMDEENPRRCKYPLVACEVKKDSVNYLIAVIKWIYYWKFALSEEAEPKEPMPTPAQFKRGLEMLKQNIVECKLYNTDVVPIWDGQQLIVIIGRS